MAGFVLVESFDLYATPTDFFTRWSSPYTPEWVLATGYNSVKALQLNAGGGQENAYRPLSSAVGTYTAGMHFKAPAVSGDRDIFGLDRAANGIMPIKLQHTADGRIQVVSYPNTILGRSAQFMVFAGGYNYIELQVTLSATVGTVDVWIDNQHVISLSNVNTLGASGNTTVDRIVIIEQTDVSPTYYDNMYVRDDLTRVGICEVLQYNAGRSDDYPGSQSTFALGTEAIYPWPVAANLQQEAFAIVGPAFSVTPEMRQSGFAICIPAYIQPPIKIIAPQRLPLYIFKGKGYYIQD